MNEVEEDEMKKLPRLEKTLSKYRDAGTNKILFLDFDGVLNAFHRTGTYPKEYYDATERFHTPNPHYNPRLRRTPRYDAPERFEIAYSPELVEGLNRLLADPTLQLIWVTTWNQHIGEPSKRMEIKTRNPEVFLQWGLSEDDQNQDRKIPALNAYIDRGSGDMEEADKIEGVRAVYIDDTTLTPEMLKTYPEPPLSRFKESLLINPESDYGLSRGEFNEVEGFFRAM